ncbi:MAG: lysyl oxidase family protein [Gaiellales bacterium]
MRIRIALVGCLLALAAAAPAAAAGSGTSHLGLITASHSVQLYKYGNQPVYLDLGVYMGDSGAPFQLNVARPRYSKPIQVSQIVEDRSDPLPSWTVTNWFGLSQFLHYTIRSSSGQVVAQRGAEFCPNSFDPQRIDPSGPLNPTFPQFCGGNPFTVGQVWGVNRGWAVNLGEQAPSVQLPLGSYSVTIAVDPRYAALFHIPQAEASTMISLSVVKPPPCPPCGGAATRRTAGLSQLPSVPIMKHPKPSTEPDLIPLPSWGIVTRHVKNSGDFLDFGATIWDAGQAPMDVEGFRIPGTNTMKAYQYFFRHGKAVGRAPAGTMQFDSSPSEQEWHFEQFAGYSLLDRTKTQVVRSRKVGFCLAPTDPIDLLIRGAVWQPYSIGLQGACGYATSLWTRETLPSGWGDTYFQYLPEQSFNITGLPNGIYYIKIQANPLGQIHEVDRTNDTRLRLVVLGGVPGHRTVRVPAWNGLDPEH